MVSFVKQTDPIRCKQCAEDFGDRVDVRTHISEVHPNILQCPYLACGYETTNRHYMKRHKTTVHEKDPIACSVIGCDFVVNYAYLKRHVRGFHADELNKTVTIKHESSVETFDDESTSDDLRHEELDLSKKISVNTNQLPCPSCSKMFWTHIQMKRHIARVHEKRYKEPVRERKFVCNVEGCGKAYTSPGKLRDHQTSHTGELPFECGRCDKQFGGRELFAKHLRQYHAVSIKDVQKMLNI